MRCVSERDLCVESSECSRTPRVKLRVSCWCRAVSVFAHGVKAKAGMSEAYFFNAYRNAINNRCFYILVFAHN